MRVALFHTTLPEEGRKPGGVEVVVHRLANALVDSGEIDVVVFSLSAAPSGARYRHRRLFRRAAWLRHPAARLLVLPALLNCVRFETADVVHFHGDDWFYARRRARTLRTFHGSALFEAQSARRLRRKFEQYGVYWLERVSRRLRDLSLAVGSDTAKLYQVRSQIDDGVDLDLFHPGAKCHHPQVLYVGTWKGRKRGDFVFDLFVREILPVFPTARLVMVADSCPLHPSVEFYRFPSDDDLSRLYRESWVLAYPSMYEGFGLVYLEALASGTAVLTSPNEGASHVLGDGRYGAIAEDRDFAERLRQMLRSDELREQLAAAGRARAAHFSWSAVAARHIAFYRELAAS